MTFQTQFPQLLQRIKADSPLIHCITNHISIHDYICQVRLENGCRLLRGTSLSIGEIAFSCGYGDPSWPSTLGRLQKSPPRPKPLW